MSYPYGHPQQPGMMRVPPPHIYKQGSQPYGYMPPMNGSFPPPGGFIPPPGSFPPGGFIPPPNSGVYPPGGYIQPPTGFMPPMMNPMIPMNNNATAVKPVVAPSTATAGTGTLSSNVGPSTLPTISKPPTSPMVSTASTSSSRATMISSQPQIYQPTNTTSVFIGKIPSGVTDEFIKQIIEQCGAFLKWNRGSDASGKLKGFGICEFTAPEGALRALRLLNDLEIGDGKLFVKVEDKVQAFLNEYLENKKKAKESTTAEGDEATTKENGEHQNSADETDEDKKKMEAIKSIIEKNKYIIEEMRKIEPVQEVLNADIFSKDRKDLTKDEKFKVIEREIEKEQQREKERSFKRKEREYREFKKEEENWENRERIKEREREKDKERERDRISRDKYYRNLDMEEYSDSDEKQRKKIRSDKAFKYRERERIDDKIDREREQEELNQQKQIKIAEQLEREKKLKQLDESLNKIRLKKPPTSSVASGFNSSNQEEDDENANHFKKKQTFIPIDMENTNNNNSSLLKKEDILQMKMDWEMIDRMGIIDSQMKSWIFKKISEFMGGTEEPLFCEHIVELLKAHLPPSEIIQKLSSILEGHSEEFVLDMFRQLDKLIPLSLKK